MIDQKLRKAVRSWLPQERKTQGRLKTRSNILKGMSESNLEEEMC